MIVHKSSRYVSIIGIYFTLGVLTLALTYTIITFHIVSPIMPNKYRHDCVSFSFITSTNLEREMAFNINFVIGLLVVQCALSLMCSAEDFDFFYFVQQWPGSYCDTSSSCCYPTTGKPSTDFGIHGLWPNNDDGSYPSNCDPDTPFVQSKVSDLISSMQEDWPTLACPSNDGTTFWTHEWNKHGTCSESVLDQHKYFKTALDLKNSLNLLQILQNAGINPDGGSYSLSSITGAIKDSIGYTPWVQCNTGSSGNSQLYQVYICIDKTGSNTIKCPIMPTGKCGSQIEFPSF